MADAAITFLLENAFQLVKQKANLIAGAKKELELLKRDLNTLKAFLRDAAKRPNKSAEFRDLERRIGDVVYDAEDAIDSCMISAAAEINRNAFSRRLIPNFDLAEKVKSLREGDVKKMVEEAGRGSEASHVESPPKPIKHLMIREKNVVGFENDEENILGYLRDEREEVDVISIIGLPGLGKTTLAWKIFKSEFVEREFANRIWVTVTQTPNIENLCLDILKGFTSDNMELCLSGPALTEKVRDYLKERKFFLVLDDVWTMEAWEDITKILFESNKMSKVVITSREEKVGKKASQPRNPYKLPLLTDEKSWELLQYEVFGKLGMCHKDLKVLGQCIAHNCRGLPLSIVVIGGILFDQLAKNDKINAVEEEWAKVSQNVTEFLKNDEKQQVSNIVELSYNRLPDESRDCLLYLAVFPEDYEISAWTLIRLWIAEGFIQGQSLEETAEDNLKDLISRNLVMVEKRSSKGDVKTCRVHDVIHAFCSSKASAKHQNLFQELKFSNGNFNPPLSEIDQYHRLCIHSHLGNFLAQADKDKAARIRSLLCFNEAPSKLPEKYTPTMVDGFDKLRVLETKSIKLDQVPAKVTKLFHLRYITLSVDTLGSLPKAFSKLLLLQTLTVYTKHESFVIKAKMQKMMHLRHLKTKAIITKVEEEDGGDGCKSLQTLSRISPEICTTDVFKKSPNLKRLGIHGNLAVLFSTPALEKQNQLEKLKLVNTFHDSESKGPMSFPKSENWFPSNLKMLTIGGMELNRKHMSTLGEIETLQVLKLKSNAFTGKSWEVERGFRSLHFLLINETNLHIWNASNDSFPRLTSLVLKKCKELKAIPDGVVEGLETLDIEYLSKSAVESAKKIYAKKKANQGQQGAARFKLTIGAGCQ